MSIRTFKNSLFSFNNFMSQIYFALTSEIVIQKHNYEQFSFKIYESELMVSEVDIWFAMQYVYMSENI